MHLLEAIEKGEARRAGTGANTPVDPAQQPVAGA
jgi:hypothetical protein